MAVHTGAHTQATYTRRNRQVWGILALSMVLFLTLCATGAASVYNYLESVTRAKDAHLQLATGSQLSVLRRGKLDREVVSKETTLGEGDEVFTEQDTEAYIRLFDYSTVRLLFNTHIKLSSLRLSSFFGSRKEIALYVDSGTAVLSTADATGYSSASYTVNTPHAIVNAESNSTVRVRITDADKPHSTEVSIPTDATGSASVTSGGKTVPIGPGFMTTARVNTEPSEEQPVEQELVRNGDFTEPPTSQAEAQSGLNTAAWQPILEQSDDDTTSRSVVTVTTESTGQQKVRAAMIDRQAKVNRYGRVGLSEDINTSVSYFHSVQLKATVKIVAQTEPVGGPLEEVFPLTIDVKYTDVNGKQRDWKHSFYYCSTGVAACNHPSATGIDLRGQYQPEPDPGAKPGEEQYEAFVLKRTGGGSTPGTPTPAGRKGDPTPTLTPALPEVGQDISVINSIEIYGIGDNFQSWITDISLTAR